MSTLEANIAILSTLSEDDQEKIFMYLSENFCDMNPYKPMSENEILTLLAESRDCYNRGEYQDFDEALNDIAQKYGL